MGFVKTTSGRGEVKKKLFRNDPLVTVVFGFVFRIGGKNWKNTGRNYWVEMRVPPKRKR